MTKVKKKKTTLKIHNLLLLFCFISSGYFIYRIYQLGPIEPLIRYIVIGVIVLLNIFFFYRKSKMKKSWAILSMVLLIIINIGLSLLIGRIYNAIDSINKNKIVYSSSLVVLANSSTKSIDDITGLKIGLVDDTLSIDNYIIAQEMIEEYDLEKDNEIKHYTDILEMLHDLYEQKIDALFISSNYSVMFSTTEGYENITNDLREILVKDKTVKKEETTSIMTKNSTTKPFTILLMGVDSEKDGLKKNAYANGDGLILITFNPYTFNATMMSIPRDSYLPISCKKNQKNKLTHAGWYGTDCMMQTIENTFDITINYYVKVNFKGVVHLVDALEGVEVDVPKKLCTDNSDRMGKICINKGIQTLNGEQALVLARNRYDLAQGDIDRGYNQQLLIKAMLKKMTSVRSVDKLLQLIDTVSNNLDTNLTTNEILSFYNIFKEIITTNHYQDGDVFNIQQIKLHGDGKMIYFPNLKMKLWAYVLNEKAIQEAGDLMKVNLELKEPVMVKTFQFKPV